MNYVWQTKRVHGCIKSRDPKEMRPGVLEELEAGGASAGDQEGSMGHPGCHWSQMRTRMKQQAKYMASWGATAKPS